MIYLLSTLQKVIERLGSANETVLSGGDGRTRSLWLEQSELPPALSSHLTFVCSILAFKLAHQR